MRSFREAGLMLLFTLALLLGAELILRIILHARHPEEGRREILYEAHPRMLITPRPGSYGTYVRDAVNGGDSIRWEINAQGFRGKPLQDTGSFRIMVFGDSNIQARFSALEQTFPARLSAWLADSLGFVPEVINAGVISYGPDQSLFRMQEEVPRQRPDLLVFHVFGDNDYGDMLRNMLVAVDEEGKLRETGTRACVPELQTGKTSLWKSLALVRVAAKIAGKIAGEPGPEDWMQVYQRWCREEYEAYMALDTARVGSGDDYDIDLATLCDPEAAGLKTRLMEAVLQEVHAYARERELPILVVVQPSAVDITRGNFHLDRASLKEHYGEYDPRRLSRTVVEICASLGMPCLDLWDSFSAHGAASLYFRAPNNHWNDRGQDLAAQLSSEKILEMIR